MAPPADTQIPSWAHEDIYTTKCIHMYNQHQVHGYTEQERGTSPQCTVTDTNAHWACTLILRGADLRGL